MRKFFLFVFVLVQIQSFSQPVDSLLSIVEKELDREVAGFSKIDRPPYYIGYRIFEQQGTKLSSSFGSLDMTDRTRTRILTTNVRVGDYSLDNTHVGDEMDDIDWSSSGRGQWALRTELPLDNQPAAIQFQLWQQTQKAYQEAVQMFNTVKSGVQASSLPAKPVADFSREKAEVHTDPPLPVFEDFFDEQAWRVRIKKLSEPFLSDPNIVEGEVYLDVGIGRKYFVSTEGTRVAHNRTYARLSISGSIRAEDGDNLSLHKTYFAFDPSRLPSDEEILIDVKAMIEKLRLLRVAPLAEPYTGPAILYAPAAGVFFHEIFGHRVEGHRFKDRDDGQTFKEQVNEDVLPKNMSVISDPTLEYFNGQALNGSYAYDDEGVKAQRVTVVDHGVLKTFLMSRRPIDNFAHSNGHGRAQSGANAVSRQSNLIVKNDKVVPIEGLRKMLIAECKKQKKAYGYFFKDVMGGFTFTGRNIPNAFNIFPTEVYRVYVDGRPDELVRGVDLIGTPLAMFAEIAAADDKSQVFTGFCGAESGFIPVTAISPSVFVKRIETQKKRVDQVEKPLLSKPGNTQ